MNIRLSMALSSTLLALACSSGGRDDAGATAPPPLASHMERVAGDFKAGRLTAAYASYVPASYDADLNDLLSRVKTLVTESEFERVQDFVGKLGAAIAQRLAADAAGDPSLGPLVPKARNLVRTLGLESYERFRALDVTTWLAHLEQSFLREWLSHPAMKERLGTHEFSVAETEGDYVALKIKKTTAGGGVAEEKEDFVAVEGKWVTVAMAAGWEPQIEKLRGALEEEAAEKEASPHVLRERLQALEGQIDALAAAVPGLLRKLRGEGAGSP